MNDPRNTSLVPYDDIGASTYYPPMMIMARLLIIRPMNGESLLLLRLRPGGVLPFSTSTLTSCKRR